MYVAVINRDAHCIFNTNTMCISEKVLSCVIGTPGSCTFLQLMCNHSTLNLSVKSGLIIFFVPVYLYSLAL